MIVNLTPHPIRVYRWNTPDRIQIDSGEHTPLHVFEPSGQLARLGMEEIGRTTGEHDGHLVPIEYVDYGSVNGLPDYDGSADGETPRTYLLVPLVVALAGRRVDLLVPFREVRNLEGTVIGCRALARVA